MENRNNSVLVALNDSTSSRAVMDFLLDLALCPEDWQISLLHFFRKSASSEELMGKKFVSGQPSKMMAVLEDAKKRLVEKGYNPKKIEMELVEQPYQTVADGIIDQVKKRNSDLIIIGRKKMSKAEEFVLGDISVKLVRALEGAAVLVVKSK